MTTEKTTRAPSDDALNGEIDRLAAFIVQSPNIKQSGEACVVLDTLMRYRADREARGHRARMAGER